MPPGSLGQHLQHSLNQPTTNPTQLLVTQMQPPMLPPPPHPNFQSVYLHTKLPATSDPLLISNSEPPITHSQTSVVISEVLGTTLEYLLTESQSHLTLTSLHTQFQKQVSDKLLIETVSQDSNIRAVSLASQIIEPFTETSVSQSLSAPFGSLNLDLYLPTPTQSPVTQTKTSHSGSVSQSSPSQAELHQSETPPKSLFPKFHHEISTVHYLTSTQPLTASVTKPQQSHIHDKPLPTLPKPTSTISTLPQPQSSPTQHQLLHSQGPLPQTEPFPHQHRNPVKIQPSLSAIHPPDQTQVQLNTSQQRDPVQSVKSANDTELTELLKRNTSQSPMTSNDPR